MKVNHRLFPICQLSMADYIIGGALFLFCFFAFYEPDLNTTGWNSLNFLYGNPLEFYENCKNIQGHGTLLLANYPPSLFAVFALWFYPFKLLGLIKSPLYFPPYMAYWMKALTSLVYVATGLVFYRVTQFYNENKNWGVYASWLWLTTPIALCSQFIYAQYDIFYVFFTVVGFLFFLKRSIFLASFIFGLAVTFKYFPIVIFLPLLLFFEKKIFRMILALLIFSIPMLIIQILYGHSPAYIEGVMGFGVLYHLFYTYVDFIAFEVKVYYIFLIFSLLCGYCYYLDLTENYKKRASYIFLFSSIFPFLFIFWHPNWLILSTPAIILTTVLNKQEEVA
ncbi:MAG: glycosyltransferase family 87 protein [Candidatus Aquirickettsiella sp.]